MSKKDERFSKISSDPKFKEMPKKMRKVEIKDKRFTGMFDNKSFNEGLEFDIYGRKLKKDSNKKDLERYYYADKEYDEDAQVDDEIQDENLLQDEEEIGEDSTPKIPEDGDSDTSEEFAEYLEQQTNQIEEDPFAELEQKEIPTGDETKRISVMNIDWENVHASDLFVLFSSFCKGKAKIEKVEIYPSEYGIQEMERENRDGPSKDIFSNEALASKSKRKNKQENILHNIDDINEDEDEDKIDGVNPLKLRKYELRKLRYYYAVAYFDSKETSLAIYQECDGMEIEKTQSFMDLRFVPDSLAQFPHPPKEVCDKLPSEYHPRFHLNNALQHSDVKLTWESSNPRRNELLAKAFSKEQFNEEEVRELLMSSDSETDEDAKLFAEELIKNSNKNEGELNLLKRKRNKDLNVKEGETIEISFNKGFEGVNQNINISKTGTKDKSMWDKYLEKKKNKRREKKQEERTMREEKKQKRSKDDGNMASKKELNLLVDQSLKNKTFKADQNDNRFAAINKDTRFAIDPTSKEYKNVKMNK